MQTLRVTREFRGLDGQLDRLLCQEEIEPVQLLATAVVRLGIVEKGLYWLNTEEGRIWTAAAGIRHSKLVELVSQLEGMGD